MRGAIELDTNLCHCINHDLVNGDDIDGGQVANNDNDEDKDTINMPPTMYLPVHCCAESRTSIDGDNIVGEWSGSGTMDNWMPAVLHMRLLSNDIDLHHVSGRGVGRRHIRSGIMPHTTIKFPKSHRLSALPYFFIPFIK